jgi:hypothetical protein
MIPTYARCPAEIERYTSGGDKSPLSLERQGIRSREDYHRTDVPLDRLKKRAEGSKSTVISLRVEIYLCEFEVLSFHSMYSGARIRPTVQWTRILILVVVVFHVYRYILV